MKVPKVTSRGFRYREFIDTYDHKCSIQESSFAEDPRLWLGVDDGAPTFYAAGRINVRMHLSQAQAAELAALLVHFSETGYLPGE